MTKAIASKVKEWGTKQKVPPSLIIAHYINKGDQFWSQLTEKKLETQLKKLYAKEKKRRERGKNGSSSYHQHDYSLFYRNLVKGSL